MALFLKFRALSKRFDPVFLLVIIFLFINLITRLGLLIYSWDSVDTSLGSVLTIFFIGFFYDLCVSTFIAIPLVLHICFTSERIYGRPGRWIATALYGVLILLLTFTNIIPKEFNGTIPKVVRGYVILRFLIYLLLLYKGAGFRLQWRKWVLHADCLLLIFLLCFNAVSEFFFWQEFGTRYNFIAVDYLVYTTEVIGNIKESYPISWILFAVLVISVLTWWPFRKRIASSLSYPAPFPFRILFLFALLLLPFIVSLVVNNSLKKTTDNTYNNELAGNGLFEFTTAFFNNSLDFYQFYKTIPDKEAFGIMRKELESPNAKFISPDIFNLERQINYPGPPTKYNIVLITVESLSASFMRAFGNKQGITPRLDSLAEKGILFTQLYASGTRTVRGLEALSLSIPPLPGQSIVKRKRNEDLFSLGSVLHDNNYTTRFIYGGYGYFDNMKYFFENNGYTVTDRTALSSKEIHYSNIWGVADEDLFTLALKKMDEDNRTNKPFLTQIMTVSNHRPYTFPKGRIPHDPDVQSREGAVAYTDYAIGKFIREASQRPWYDNTVFVIVADHCAKASGKTDLPVSGYHIPMIIFAPKIFEPRKFDRLTSQIDIVPTILGIVKLNYRTKFFGRDIFNDTTGSDRALLSTYQGLGYFTGNDLLVQMPPKEIKQYRINQGGEQISTALNDSLAKMAIAYYQTTAWLFRNDKFRHEKK